MKKSNYAGNKKIEGLYQKIINQITPFENFIELFAGTSRGLASVGDLVNQMYKLKTELPSTKPALPKAENGNCAKPP